MTVSSQKSFKPGLDGGDGQGEWAGISTAQRLRCLLAGSFVSQAVHAAAELDVAERLTDGPKDAATLAEETVSHADALYRLLRALASVGIFREDEQGRFANTELSKLLCRGVPDSQRAAARMAGSDLYWRTAGRLLQSVRTGEPVFETLFGAPFFDYLTRNSDYAHIFDEAMVSTSQLTNAVMLEAYDFSHLRTIMDVGGGYGSTLCAILHATPGLRGILFDLPRAAEGARRFVAEQGLSSRCDVMAGNGFDAVPAGAEAYFMRHILHDWDDERCIRLLRNCQVAMASEGKLLVCERILPTWQPVLVRQDHRLDHDGSLRWSGTHRSTVSRAFLCGRIHVDARGTHWV